MPPHERRHVFFFPTDGSAPADGERERERRRRRQAVAFPSSLLVFITFALYLFLTAAEGLKRGNPSRGFDTVSASASEPRWRGAPVLLNVQR